MYCAMLMSALEVAGHRLCRLIKPDVQDFSSRLMLVDPLDMWLLFCVQSP